MATTNDEFWTLEANNLLVDQRIAKDSVFRTSNSDQNGWLKILDELRKAGAPKSLNRVHVRRQWTKICEEYKKIAELSNGNSISIEEFNVPYYAKLKEFFEKKFAQTEQQKSDTNNDDEKKLITATLLKENSFRQCYADRWTISRTNLLIDTRIAKNDFFKGRGHTAAAWQIVLADMILLGEPETLTVPQMKKKWDNLVTRYQDLIKTKSTKLNDWPYFEKLHDFLTSKTVSDINESCQVNTSIPNTEIITTFTPDRWTQESTNILIDIRIARNDYFQSSTNRCKAWQIVLDDMIQSGEAETLTIERIKKKWDNLKNKYYSLEKSNTTNKPDWPYFQKLHTFLNDAEDEPTDKISDQEEDTNHEVPLIEDEKNDPHKWTNSTVDLLIKTRIAKNDYFKGRGNSEKAWQVVVSTMQKSLNLKSLTTGQVKKKWHSLYTDYLKMKNSKKNAKWPHYEVLHSFYTNNKIRKVEKSESMKYEDYSESQSSLMKNKCYADRWPTKRIKLLIQKRIARDPMFDGRKLSSAGWKTILQDMRAAGTPQNITILQIKKKWENLCRKYKLIKNNNKLKKSWPLFKEMDEFFKIKDLHVKLEEPLENCVDFLQKSTIGVKRNLNDGKITKCRLCQEEKSEYLLTHNKELCGKISECLSINVFENMDLLPMGVCKKCKKTIDAFYPFVIRCRNVDKELHDAINLTPEADIKIEPMCMIDDETINKFSFEKDKNSDDYDDDDSSIKDPVSSTFECSECPVAFNSSEALKVHLKSHCNSSRYFCDMCNSSFSRQSALYSHIKTHFEMGNMLVVLPGDSQDDDEDTIIDNNLIIHGDDDNNHASDANTNGDSIENIASSLTDTTISCVVCRKIFTSRRILRDHLQTHSRTMLKCPREGCNKTYASLKSLENHEMKHLGLKSFLCVVCGKGFVTKNALQTHEKIHLDVKEYECNVCSIRFAVASNLRAHQKKHHEGVRFYCSQCPKEFLSKDSLKRHEIAHTGIKDFICDICSAAFYTAKELRKHKFYHDGTRMHHCNLCFKTFYEKHHLTVHMRSHTDERPYPCKVSGCGKAFRESQKLRRHMKQQHRFQNE